MTNLEVNWALPGFLGFADSDLEEPDYSKLALRILWRLNAAFPDRVNLLDCSKIAEHEDVVLQLWDWMRVQGMVAGHMDNCSLTLSGKSSFVATLHEMPEKAKILLANDERLEIKSWAKFLLAVSRNHFEGSRA